MSFTLFCVDMNCVLSRLPQFSQKFLRAGVTQSDVRADLYLVELQAD